MLKLIAIGPTLEDNIEFSTNSLSREILDMTIGFFNKLGEVWEWALEKTG